MHTYFEHHVHPNFDTTKIAISILFSFSVVKSKAFSWPNILLSDISFAHKWFLCDRKFWVVEKKSKFFIYVQFIAEQFVQVYNQYASNNSVTEIKYKNFISIPVGMNRMYLMIAIEKNCIEKLQPSMLTMLFIATTIIVEFKLF